MSSWDSETDSVLRFHLRKYTDDEGVEKCLESLNRRLGNGEGVKEIVEDLKEVLCELTEQIVNILVMYITGNNEESDKEAEEDDPSAIKKRQHDPSPTDEQNYEKNQSKKKLIEKNECESNGNEMEEFEKTAKRRLERFQNQRPILDEVKGESSDGNNNNINNFNSNNSAIADKNGFSLTEEAPNRLMALRQKLAKKNNNNNNTRNTSTNSTIKNTPLLSRNKSKSLISSTSGNNNNNNNNKFENYNENHDKRKPNKKNNDGSTEKKMDSNLSANNDNNSSLENKSSIQCKFFPECKNLSCPFYHPEKCKFFPKCKNSRCSYYHPNSNELDRLNFWSNPLLQQLLFNSQMMPCKFGYACSTSGCVFIHPLVECRYGENCKNPQTCQFGHTKLCRNGIKCHTVSCTFSHPSKTGELDDKPFIESLSKSLPLTSNELTEQESN